MLSKVLSFCLAAAMVGICLTASTWLIFSICVVLWAIDHSGMLKS